MARLITKFKYLNKNGKKPVGGYAKYIATREGVDKIDKSMEHAQATNRQEILIQKILRDFPDTRDMLEYADYFNHPTRRNASEFITRAIEENAYEALTQSTFADYIATRPRAERFGTHGLFTDDGVPVLLSQVSEELNQHQGNIWTGILSLRREDAAKLGFDTGERWRDMLRSQASTLANNMKIPLENFHWYAAFHNESHHPHVHLIAYSTVENEGFLTQKGVMNLRSAYAKSIFAEELAEIFVTQAQHRKDLRQESRDMIARVVEQINSNAYDNPAVEQKLLELSVQLTGLGGKKEYKYLRHDLKPLVDDIVKELSADERIQQLYDLWYQMREENMRIYTDELPERIPLADNPEFRTFKNAVIQEAMHIVKKEITVEDPEEFSPWHMEIPDEEPEPTPTDDETPPLPREETPAKKESDYLLWLKELAHQNNSYGQYMLGKILLRDEPTEQDLREGEMWLRRAISNGNIYAPYVLGKAMLSGVIKTDDTDEAIRLIEQSADDGASAARYLMGKLLYKGELTDQDIPRAIEYLKDAASQFNRHAAYLLGKILVVEPEHRDIESALSYLERAARYGNHYAEYFLGKLYLYGKEVPQDVEKALDYLKAAAEHGNPYADQLLNSVRSNGSWSAAVGSLRLLHHISRMFQNRVEEAMRQNEITAVDKRIRQKTEEKRQAHGLKHG